MIEAEFLIEAQGNDRDAVAKSLRELEEKIKAEDGVRLRKAEYGDVVKEELFYSAVAEFQLEFANLQSYLNAAIRYGPSAIYVLSPERLTLTAEEFLLTLGEIIKLARKFYQSYHVGFEFEPEEEVSVGIEDYEIEELLKEGAIHVKLVAEVMAESEAEAVRILVGDIKDEAPVNKVKSTFNEESGAYLVAVDAFALDARALFSIALRHVPVLIEILEPKEITLSMLDLQDIALDIAGVFFEASQRLALS
jgi:hypothetical protein